MAEYIEREALLDHFQFRIPVTSEIGNVYKECVDTARKIIIQVPAADVVEIRHGVWVEGAEHFTNGFYEAECSECNNYIRWNEGNSGDWNYCPNCGAKMDGKGEGE